MTIQDFGVTYAELEPYYDKFEKLCGVSGKAGNLRGKKIEGGNVFEGPRRTNIRTSRWSAALAGALFEEGSRRTSATTRSRSRRPMRATPTPIPKAQPWATASIAASANASAARANAKASPECEHPAGAAARSEIRAAHACLCERTSSTTRQAKKVKSVRYVDTRNGEEYEQPAGIVILGRLCVQQRCCCCHVRASASPTIR